MSLTLGKIELQFSATLLKAGAAVSMVFLFFVNDAGSQTQQQKFEDGPVSVKHESVYKLGQLKIEPYELRDLPPLPRNYQALDNRAYLIGHTGEVTGPHIVRFAAKSVTDEKEFDDLRIFQAQPDQFDPQSPSWADVTELSSTKLKPNFKNKTLAAKTDRLGVYVIAKLVGKPSKNSKADLAVSFSGVLEKVRSPNPIPFTVQVLNKGPDVATDVGLRSGLPTSSRLLRVETSQGKCKELMGHLYCKLGNLKPHEAALISFVITPNEGGGSFREEGEEMSASAYAASNETDPVGKNDLANAETLALPNLNRAPVVSIETPVSGAVYVGPTDLIIKAKAEDPDGTISKVQFYDNGVLIGSGAIGAETTFEIKKSKPSYGLHVFEAVATDNQGRQNRALAGGILINGPATINIIAPQPEASFAPRTDIKMVATVKHPAGSSMKIEFRDVAGKVFGEGVSGPQDQYTFIWRNVEEGSYALVVVATDAAGVPTMSPPVMFTVLRN